MSLTIRMGRDAMGGTAADMRARRRAQIEASQDAAAAMGFDAGAYVADMTDDELRDLIRYGPNLATEDERRAAIAAAKHRRQMLNGPIQVPTSHGMGANQRQAGISDPPPVAPAVEPGMDVFDGAAFSDMLAQFMQQPEVMRPREGNVLQVSPGTTRYLSDEMRDREGMQRRTSYGSPVARQAMSFPSARPMRRMSIRPGKTSGY